MSGWDQYITSLTSQGITHAGIFGFDGSRWAASASFPVRNPIDDHACQLSLFFDLEHR
jgi:hypothetical protein